MEDPDIRNCIIGFLIFMGMITCYGACSGPDSNQMKACGEACHTAGRQMEKIDRDGCFCADAPR